jgi:5-methylcytosine-specific restriction endonuclease McrA
VAKGYDLFLVYTKLGTDRKLRRLTAAEKWCAVFGVWATAAESPVRGYLLIAGEEPAAEEDYATQAGVTLAIARSTVKKMRDLGLLEFDEEMGVEHVHDWHEHEPELRPSRGRPWEHQISPELRDAVIERDRGLCGICQRPTERDDEIHIDHIQPLSHGGATDLPNLQLSHAICNLRKGNRV